MKLLARIVLTALAAAALIGGIIVLGRWLRDDPQANNQRRLPLSAIDCTPPPNLTRDKFLDEVHFYGQLPTQIDLLDAGMPERLKAAFAKHPRVQEVRSVLIEPPDRVRVELTYRKE